MLCTHCNVEIYPVINDVVWDDDKKPYHPRCLNAVRSESRRRVFIISSVRLATDKFNSHLDNYVEHLEKLGVEVYLPKRDTDQTASYIERCRQNRAGIERADEVHIFYDSTSLGTHFDMGMSFCLNKPIKVIETEPYDESKRFVRMLEQWQESQNEGHP
jgi:nucleoside 2-deoxyribosyltransferase